MDLVAGARRVIVAMEHNTKDGGKDSRALHAAVHRAEGGCTSSSPKAVIDVTPDGFAAARSCCRHHRGCGEGRDCGALIIPDKVGRFD